MATMVFDIETTAQPINNFDEAQQEYLFREAENQPDEVAREKKRLDIAHFFGLWPLTGQIVCIGMLNPQTGRGKALYLSEDFEDESSPDEEIEYVAYPEEADLLAHFWELALKFDSVVTFNGRNFDVPYLYLRSALLNIPITRKNWLGYRFSDAPTVIYWSSSPLRIRRADRLMPSLQSSFYCKAFGIPSPKAQGVTGNDIAQMIQEGLFRQIAEYCIRDVYATAELYKIWKERLSPER